MKEQNSGCTVGLTHLPDGILFFKNRDLAREHHAHQIAAFASTADVHVLKGVNLKTKTPEGVSIGVNRHRICVASTHVASTADVSYDLLCERLVHETREREDVPRLVREFMAGTRVQGGRILICSPDWGVLIEVLGSRYEMQAIHGNWVMTNTFSLLPPVPDRPPVREQSSATRQQVASAHLQSLSTIGQLKRLLRSHIPEKGELSICNHRQDGGGTESSHIIHIQGGDIAWFSLAGFPCENDYHCVQLFSGEAV